MAAWRWYSDTPRRLVSPFVQTCGGKERINLIDIIHRLYADTTSHHMLHSSLAKGPFTSHSLDCQLIYQVGHSFSHPFQSNLHSPFTLRNHSSHHWAAPFPGAAGGTPVPPQPPQLVWGCIGPPLVSSLCWVFCWYFFFVGVRFSRTRS